jgi:hypothetical protein
MSITESSNEGDPIFKIRKFVYFNKKKKQSKQRNVNDKSQLNLDVLVVELGNECLKENTKFVKNWKKLLRFKEMFNLVSRVKI